MTIKKPGEKTTAFKGPSKTVGGKAIGRNSPQGKKNLPLLLLLLLLCGGFYYYHFEYKTTPSSAVVDEKSVPAAKKGSGRKLIYLVRELKLRGLGLDSKKLTGMEEAFRDQGLEVDIEVVPVEKRVEEITKNRWDVLLDSINLGILLRAKGVAIETLAVNKSCTVDTRLITTKDSPLTLESIKDAKKIVIYNSGFLTPGQLSLPITLGIDPASVFVSTDREAVVSAFENGQVDGVIEEVLTREQGKKGFITGNKSSEGVKEIFVTNYAIPCRALMVKKEIDQPTREKFMSIINQSDRVFKGGGESAGAGDFEKYFENFDLKKIEDMEKNIKPFEPAGQPITQPENMPLQTENPSEVQPERREPAGSSD